jgi:glycerate dehydrogenase
MSENNVIVVLDGHTLNPGDLSWDALAQLGVLHVYPRSTPSEIIERAQGANIILVNKVRITREAVAQLPDLRCICVTATGYNNIDLEAASERGIAVCNVRGYGTEAVAQHVFALLLYFSNQVALHSQAVQAGEWSGQADFSFWKKPIASLQGATMGVYGFGQIGQKVAEIASAFGMQVLATHKHPERDARPGVSFVGLPELFAASDVLSLHAPLSAENRGIVNWELLQRTKPHAILINTARGELIVEDDLARALHAGKLGAAALDVLCQEPPPLSHPLLHAPRCIVTPHQAWAAFEARKRLLDLSVDTVRGFLNGTMPSRIA